MKKRKTIVLCSSASFYKELFDIQKTLRKMGYKVLIPVTAYKMKRTNNYDIGTHKKWLKDPKLYEKKQKLMDGHFKKVVESDAILVTNFDKKGIKGYIGGNVLMEITLAYFLKKKIFILFDIDEDSPIKEEVYGVKPVFLNGDASSLIL